VAGGPSADRLRFLDGLRGLLAVQVVVYHYVFAFAPSLSKPIAFHDAASPLQAWIAGTPLYFLIDGASAVFVFFLISGFVLTPSFGAQWDQPLRNVIRRVIRLFIPAAGAILLGFLLYRLLPDASRDAASLSHAQWLMTIHPGIASMSHLAAEIFTNSAFVGYRGTSLFDYGPLLHLATPGNMAVSLNAPLWTLHTELYGSVLLVVLVYLSRRIVWLYWLAVVALVITIPCAPIFLFLVGHLIFLLDRRFLASRRLSPWPMAVGGYGLIVLGIVICGTPDIDIITRGYAWLSAHTFLPAFHLYGFKNQTGAVCLFIGIVLAVRSGLRWNLVGRVLNSRLVQISGKYSFPIYLVHFPILFTVSCYLYVVLAPYLPRQALALVVFILGAAIMVPVVILFERFIDAPAIGLSRKLKVRPAVSNPGDAHPFTEELSFRSLANPRSTPSRF
jgi:peptidoglycan/LPS O-acetylase OafA/YrhL